MTLPLDDDAGRELALIAAELSAGLIDEPEAYQRCLDAGCTPHGARVHVASWVGQEAGS
jgi:hypothetical protein